MSTGKPDIFVQTSSVGSVGPGNPAGKVLRKMVKGREARLTKKIKKVELEVTRIRYSSPEDRAEKDARALQVLENIFPFLDAQEMKIKLGKALFSKIEQYVRGNVLDIHVTILKNNNNETLLKMLQDFNFFKLKVRQSH